jgi:hypothetical protein
MARNSRFRIVAARAWPRTHVIVLDDVSGALVEHYVRTSLFG